MINILTTIKEKNIALNFTLISLPIILIVLSMIELGKYIIKQPPKNDK